MGLHTRCCFCRNTWIWGCTHEGCTLKPSMKKTGAGVVACKHSTLKKSRFYWDVDSQGVAPQLLFTENESNTKVCFYDLCFFVKGTLSVKPRPSWGKTLICTDYFSKPLFFILVFGFCPRESKEIHLWATEDLISHRLSLVAILAVHFYQREQWRSLESRPITILLIHQRTMRQKGELNWSLPFLCPW